MALLTVGVYSSMVEPLLCTGEQVYRYILVYDLWCTGTCKTDEDCPEGTQLTENVFGLVQSCDPVE
jgi:hypothetical protein